jgi:hypothetical protein
MPADQRRRELEHPGFDARLVLCEPVPVWAWC